ncbi:MAG: hypothetical protein R3D98_15485 [Candidatus Krumholzibacteriia bacterium]
MDAWGVATLAVDAGLVVLVWLVQRIIYPAFADIEPARFREYHRGYGARIAQVVVPLMVAQAALHGRGLLVAADPVALAAAGGIVAAWAVTFLGAVPCHRRLAVAGCEAGLLRRLLRWNLMRAVAWTLVLGLVLVDLR